MIPDSILSKINFLLFYMKDLRGNKFKIPVTEKDYNYIIEEKGKNIFTLNHNLIEVYKSDIKDSIDQYFELTRNV